MYKCKNSVYIINQFTFKNSMQNLLKYDLWFIKDFIDGCNEAQGEILFKSPDQKHVYPNGDPKGQVIDTF